MQYMVALRYTRLGVADAPVRGSKAQAGNVHLESYCFKSDEKGAIGEISKGAAALRENQVALRSESREKDGRPPRPR